MTVAAGRELVKAIQLDVDTFKQQCDDSSGFLSIVSDLQKDDPIEYGSLSGKIEQVNRYIPAIGSARVESLISSGLTKVQARMLEYIREGIRSLFPADKDKIIEWKSEVTQHICSFLEVLIKSEKFVKLIDDFGIQLNKQTLQTLFIIVDHRSRFDTVAVKDLTADAASNELTFSRRLHEDAACVERKALNVVLEAYDVASVISWFGDAIKSTRSAECMDVAIKQATPTIHAIKTEVVRVFEKGISGIDMNDAKDVKLLAGFTLPPGIPLTYQILKMSKPGAANELQFIGIFGQAVREVCLLRSARLELTDRKARSMDASRCEQLVKIRSCVTNLIRIGDHNIDIKVLFTKEDGLFGKLMDLSGFEKLVEQFRAFTQEVLDGWVKDCNDLVLLSRKYNIPVDRLTLDKILQEPNKELLNKFIVNESLDNASKTVVLLSRWQGLLKTIKNDGSDPALGCISAELYQEMTMNINMLKATVELTQTAMKVCVMIPGIVNVKVRKDTAANFIEVQRKKGVYIGSDFMEALTKYADPSRASTAPAPAAADV